MSGSAPDWLTARPIAHRGLHDLAAGRPENSLAAFRAAMTAGYAIECDLQPSAEGVPMVFHDFELDRLGSVNGLVAETGTGDLQRMTLLGTEETVPTLRSMLELVADAVPIVLELKGPQADADAFVMSVAAACEDYTGRLAVMSFDHTIVRRFANFMPERPRGLTALGDDRLFEDLRAVYDEADLAFVSYDVEALPSRFVAHVRETGGSAITWTVRTPEQVSRTARHADQMTFEGFLPPLGPPTEPHTDG